MGLPSLKFFCNPGTLPKTDKMLMGPPPRFVIHGLVVTVKITFLILLDLEAKCIDL